MRHKPIVTLLKRIIDSQHLEMVPHLRVDHRFVTHLFVCFKQCDDVLRLVVFSDWSPLDDGSSREPCFESFLSHHHPHHQSHHLLVLLQCNHLRSISGCLLIDIKHLRRLKDVTFGVRFYKRFPRLSVYLFEC